MADHVLSSLVQSLADKQLQGSRKDVRKAQRASKSDVSEAEKCEALRSLARITPVSGELLEVNALPAASTVQQWAHRSELAVHRQVRCVSALQICCVDDCATLIASIANCASVCVRVHSQHASAPSAII
jgi:hypothetical protein